MELLGQTEFPRIGEQPYFLTLAPYGFYWFQLQEAVGADHRPHGAACPTITPPCRALFVGVVWDSVLDGGLRSIIERQALVPFLERQRWFGGKARPLAAARFVDWMSLRRGAHPAFLTIVEAEYRDGGRERYVLPLAMSSGREAAAIEHERPTAVLARITGARKGLLHDGLLDDGTCQMLLAAVRDRQDLAMKHGSLQASRLDSARRAGRAAEALTPIVRSAPDQSNTSVMFGKRIFMKMFRRIEPGLNPDVEIGEFLAERGFAPRAAPARIAVVRPRRRRAGRGRHAAGIRLQPGQRVAGDDRRARPLLRAHAGARVADGVARGRARVGVRTRRAPAAGRGRSDRRLPDDGGGAGPAHRRAASRSSPSRRRTTRRSGWNR